MSYNDGGSGRDGGSARRSGSGDVDALGPVSGDYETPPPTVYSSNPPGDEYAKAVIPMPVIETRPAPGFEGETAKSQSKKKGSSAVREIVETLLLAFIIFVAVRAVVLNFRVDGSSMVPNLHNQEMLLVNRNVYFHFDLNKWISYVPGIERDGERIVYPFHPPERGDIIVFDPPTVSDKPYIKRVIAVAGETVQIKEGAVYINDVKLDEPYIEDGITECNRSKCDPVLVPEGQIWVMGDNRRASSDSRVFGPIEIDSIIGKAWITYWPFSDFGIVPHFDYPGVKD